MVDLFGGESQNLVSELKLVDLPTDALLCIFNFCDSKSLRNLSVTCRRLHGIASEDCVWIKRSNESIITNQLSDKIFKRSLSKLGAKERCKISLNWIHGCYGEKIYSTKTKYMPWIHLESDCLWISRGRSIVAVRRLGDGLKMQNPQCVIQTGHKEDISRFVMTGDVIFSGGKDKYICGWSISLQKPVLCEQSNHSQDIQGLDCKRHILVSGSKDNFIKVWQVGETGESLNCAQTLNVYDRVWCVALDPVVSCVAVGSAGYYGVHPFHLYNLDRGTEIPMTKSVSRNGAAVFDIHWECPNTLVTCGFDTITRLWDLRVGACVGRWADPFGAPGYCLATDQRHAVLCGTAHHGRAQLWDKRSPISLQSYFGRSGASSPVYSLSFDPGQLFIAQDSCINVLDFTTSHGQPGTHRADYSSYWANNRDRDFKYTTLT